MSGSTLGRIALLAISGGAASLALAQAPEPQDFSHMLLMSSLPALGILLVLAIVAIALFHDRRQTRQRLSVIERLVAAGHSVPRELITGEKPPLPLHEEQRRDVRRGITLLAWAIAVALIPIIGSGNWRYGVWSLLFLLPSLGSFFKAWLSGREIARGASSGSPQP